jgi:twinfilin-like protein
VLFWIEENKMSHQTGIKCNEDLRGFFAKAKEGRMRLIKVIINNSEQLALETYKETSSKDWKLDYNDCVVPVLDPKTPCYLFYRLDDKNDNNGYMWLFITWSPDFASVKNKMLYAATKSTLKLEFGAGHIKDELFGTVKEDCSLEGYLKHLKSQLAPKPMTNREEELEQIKLNETRTNINVDTKQKTLQGVMFPLEKRADDYLIKFQNGFLNYLQFTIDIKNQLILLDRYKENLNADQFASECNKDNGCFHLYRFIHRFDNVEFKNVLFIYSMPGFSASIKERMLYSSCKNEFLNFIKSNYSLVDVSKTFEISEANEITEDFLIEELHPKQAVSAKKFDKPKLATKGPRRITRGNDD